MFSHDSLGTEGPHLSRGWWSQSRSHLPAAGILLTVLAAACAAPAPPPPEVGRPPQLTWSPPLAYPPAMFESGTEGRVVLQAMVDTAGNVEAGSVSVVSSTHHAFERPAIEMLRNSRFVPGSTPTRAIRTQIRVPIVFDLKKGETVSDADSAAAATLVGEAEQLVARGNIADALTAYAAAQHRDARLNGSIDFWYGLCWNGSLWGHAGEVMFACDQAVELAPREARTREARGVARALVADYAGAIDDLEESVARAAAGERRTRLLSWMSALRAGENPFTDSVLERLRTPTE